MTAETSLSDKQGQPGSNTPTPTSGQGWTDMCQKAWCKYGGKSLPNPYRLNKFGFDMMTETALEFSHWKRENVFPVDLKLRAPAVLFGVVLCMSGWVKSFPKV